MKKKKGFKKGYGGTISRWLGFVSLVMFFLKVMGGVHIPWIWVFIPIWLPGTLVVVALMFVKIRIKK